MCLHLSQVFAHAKSPESVDEAWFEPTDVEGWTPISMPDQEVVRSVSVSPLAGRMMIFTKSGRTFAAGNRAWMGMFLHTFSICSFGLWNAVIASSSLGGCISSIIVFKGCSVPNHDTFLVRLTACCSAPRVTADLVYEGNPADGGKQPPNTARIIMVSFPLHSTVPKGLTPVYERCHLAFRSLPPPPW